MLRPDMSYGTGESCLGRLLCQGSEVDPTSTETVLVGKAELEAKRLGKGAFRMISSRKQVIYRSLEEENPDA